MFRYRQTLHLRKNLEARFADLLRSFGLGTEQNSAAETEGAKMPKNRETAEARKPNRLKPAANNSSDHRAATP